LISEAMNERLTRVRLDRRPLPAPHSTVRPGPASSDRSRCIQSATQYGLRKGVQYSKELGAEKDRISEHSTVIFPFCTQIGKAGAPRSEYQLRIPIDDTHTLHMCYQQYGAPDGLTVPYQEVVPWYAPPTVDEHGKPILDYVLAQDALVWASQGPILDRSQEILGRTDIPIALLRKQLAEQITIVENGERPMNVFDESPESIDGSGKPPGYVNPELQLAGTFRTMYHRGYGTDDADRYGPIIEIVKDLHRRIEEFHTAQKPALVEAKSS